MKLKQKKSPDIIARIELDLMGRRLILVSRYLPPDVNYCAAPALIPKEGYRFAGYIYDSFNNLCATPVYDMSGVMLFPVAAVYSKWE